MLQDLWAAMSLLEPVLYVYTHEQRTLRTYTKSQILRYSSGLECALLMCAITDGSMPANLRSLQAERKP